MGNVSSDYFEVVTPDPWWQNSVERQPLGQLEETGKVTRKPMSPEEQERNERLEDRKRQRAEKLVEFKEELSKKHEQHRKLIADRKKEMRDLRDELTKQKKENEELKILLQGKCTHNYEIPGNPEKSIEENAEHQNKIAHLQMELLAAQKLNENNLKLKMSIAELHDQLQAVNAEVVAFEKERHDYQSHVLALKDVIKVSKQLLRIREGQTEQLKRKNEIMEKTLAEKELEVLSNDLRAEYERQLKNIRNLRSLYEERQRANKLEKDKLQRELEDERKSVEHEQKKNCELQERIGELEKDSSEKYDSITNLQSALGLAKAEHRELQNEVNVINQLFSQILLSVNNCQEVDLDKLIKLLEENHDLLTNMVVNEGSTEVAAALPKTLLDLINQVNEKKEKNPETSQETNDHLNQKLETIVEESESPTSSHQTLNSAEEIVQNLPKVWKVLAELLSQQTPPVNIVSGDGDDRNPCYKVVQTVNGPQLVLSVSQTFIRLKDLIVEKKSVEKEMSHLKQLNGHLETRLQEQVKRLENVSNELTKTWRVVGKMQKQHQLLHTQEKILRYELAQKRKLLTELKEELEYCREKWVLAREKNVITENQWKELRSEFSARKTVINDDLNNSAESGYSDEKCSSDEDDRGYEADSSVASPPPLLDYHPTENVEESHLEQNEISITEPTSICSSDTPNSSAIFEVITNEISKIESPSSSKENDKGSLSTENIVLLHSAEGELKTDLVQSENEEKTQVQIDDLNAACSSSTSADVRSQEQILSAREERLKRLEEQCQQLVQTVTNTSNRGTQMCTKLNSLHEQYGNEAVESNENDAAASKNLSDDEANEN